MITSPEPEKIYRLMESRPEANAAIDEVVSLAARELRIFAATPAQLAERNFNQATHIEALRALLLANPAHRVRIVLHETQGIETELPRLMTLVTQFSVQLPIHRTLGAAQEARDTMIIADDKHVWRRIHQDHPRSVVTLHSPADTRVWLERFEEIWDLSEIAIHGGVTGL